MNILRDMYYIFSFTNQLRPEVCITYIDCLQNIKYRLDIFENSKNLKEHRIVNFN